MKKLVVFLLVVISGNISGQSLPDSASLTGFFDGLIEAHMRDKHIAGATVAVIKDGKILLAKGYGFADEKKQIPVNPESTLFRIGSISKMFTWISVMQLVAQGKLKLDEDVNHYFKDFKIPETYPRPVTLKELMTHTPGFEDKVLGLFGRDSTTLKPLGEILAKEMPARVREPGSFSSYSNHGTGMAAYIVEQVSGLSFNDYVEKNILTPLGMSMTTFRQPLPSNFKPHMSKGYTYEAGEFKEQIFEFVPLYPVGAAASTAVDMTRFMQAILDHGKSGNFQLLDSTTLALMESPAHRHHPAVNPMRHGFMDLSQNGQTVIGHGGDTFWFHSLMALLPEHNAGLFVSFNTDKGGGTYLSVLDEFMNRYYPEQGLKNPIKLSNTALKRFEGDYRPNRYAYHDITTISSLLGDAHIVALDSTGLKLIMGETKRTLLPIDSLTFRDEHSSKVYAFDKNNEGQIAHLFVGQMPIFALDKVSGARTLGFQSMIFFFVTATMLLVLIYWPLAWWVRLGYHSDGDRRSLRFDSKWPAWLNFLLLFVFYVGVMMAVSGPTDIVYGVPASLKILLVLPLICILLTLWMTVCLFRIWAGRYRLSVKVFYFVVTAASIAALTQLAFWNFIGFNY